MTLLGVAIVAAALFLLFILILFINIYASTRQMAKILDTHIGSSANHFTGIVGAASELLNRGLFKVVIHIICGAGAAASAFVSIGCFITYLVKVAKG